MFHISPSFAQSGDDSDFDPKPKPLKPVKPEPKPPIPVPPIHSNFFVLPNYLPGAYNHVEVQNFCHKIIVAIDGIKQKNRIINITVKGYADGLINRGVIISKSEVHGECQKFISSLSGLEDTELATLRACQIEGIIKDQLLARGETFTTFLRFNNENYDEPDGGNSGGLFRKVEITITHSKK